MPKKVDPLLLGVWLVLQASQAPMGGWGPRAEPERGQSCFRPSGLMQNLSSDHGSSETH